MRRRLLVIALAAAAVLALACGGSGDDRNTDAFGELDTYPQAVEIDRHSEEVQVEGQAQRVLKVQFATTDTKQRVQAFYGEKLLRAGYRTDTRPDDTVPKDALRFRTAGGKGSIVITFSDQRVEWAPNLGVQPGESPPPGAATFYVVNVRIGE